MKNIKFTLNNDCIVKGRHNLTIRFNYQFPEDLLVDKSLVGLEGQELKRALDKPFYLLKKLMVSIEYDNNNFSFIIPEKYDWNGANVPFFAWLLIGQQKEPRFKLASMVHDYLCEHKDVINYNRYLSTLVFETLCEYFGRFNSIKRWAMFHTVDNFQKLQKGWK